MKLWLFKYQASGDISVVSINSPLMPTKVGPYYIDSFAYNPVSKDWFRYYHAIGKVGQWHMANDTDIPKAYLAAALLLT